MKITAKTTKEQLVQFIGMNAKEVQKQDKDLFSRLAYADKMMKADEKKVTKKDLVDLAREVMKSLGDKIVEPALAQETPVKAENSTKKLSKGISKKQETKEVPESVESEKTAEEPAETEEKVDKKSAKKSLGKKKAKKDDATTPEDGIVQSDVFPETLKVGDTEYKLAHDIQSMDDLYNELEKDEAEIVFAFYWTKAHLKKYPYFYNMLGKPKSFEHDLDLATTIYVSEEKKIAYHISMYTEGCYNTLPEDFEEVDGIRYAGAVEFQIYRAV